MSGRRRYIAVGNKWVEVSNDYTPEPPDRQNLLWNDRQYQDMNDPRFNSRETHREYMRRNGLTTADDFTGEWATAAKKREEFYKGIDPNRGSDLARAAERVQQGYRPRRLPEDV